MSKKRVHILSAVNAGNVSKDGATYTIRDVVGAVDDIVMNGRLYPADQLAASAHQLTGKPAPAGHPKNSAGQYISATNGDALIASYVGAICKNARHTAGRTMVDIVVNEQQAKAHADGAKLIERLDSAIAGTNSEPIHVSTGLNLTEVMASGESMGKKYRSIAVNLEYDHLAILLNECGAGTPEQGVGMFLNSAGQPEDVETVEVNTAPADMRHTGLTGWIRKLLGNESDLSFGQISEGLRALLPRDAYPSEVFSKYFVWADYASEKLYKQDYAVDSEGSVKLLSEPIEVVRQVEYEEVSNQSHERADPVKDHILAALNAAGIAAAGLDDSQLLTAYNQLQAKPHIDALNAANAKVAQFEVNAKATEEAELNALATSMAVNSSLTVDDLKKLGIARLKEIGAKAAPVVVAANSAPASDFAAYDLNAILEGK